MCLYKKCNQNVALLLVHVLKGPICFPFIISKGTYAEGNGKSPLWGHQWKQITGRGCNP